MSGMKNELGQSINMCRAEGPDGPWRWLKRKATEMSEGDP